MKPISSRRFLPSLCLLVPLCLVPIRAFADPTEDIFGRAVLYTVQIKAAVPVPFEGEEQGAWSGAGFLVDRQRGWIMTNAHVASRSPSTMEVGFKDRDFVDAYKVYVDPYLDLAIIAIDNSLIPPESVMPELDCGDLPRVGHTVGAFGHPWGLSFTGTRGIISGILFGKFYYRDKKVMPVGDIMVHSVQKGSIGNLSNNEKGDILDGVDGHDIRSLEDFYGGLGKVKDHEKITLRLKRFADPPVDSVFEYIEQTIKVEDLRWVSQEKRP